MINSNIYEIKKKGWSHRICHKQLTILTTRRLKMLEICPLRRAFVLWPNLIWYSPTLDPAASPVLVSSTRIHSYLVVTMYPLSIVIVHVGHVIKAIGPLVCSLRLQFDLNRYSYKTLFPETVYSCWAKSESLFG